MDNVFAGKWKQFSGEIKRRWGKLTDDDIREIDGNWQKFVGRLQERYGKSTEASEEAAKRFFDKLH